MPRTTSDVVEAASRCFHINTGALVPHYVVIRHPIRQTYAVTTIATFLSNLTAHTADGWIVAINLSPEDIMALMGIIPKKPTEPSTDPQWIPDPPRDLKFDSFEEELQDARSSEDL
jgi:hypothetical protein